ncbi:2OG-Fe(II) oxygenase [Pandoraea sp.]|uniref:2OG-Fe(II) oxygenase n=1 Tax=Pandoraea sp. TaxID=1883445 RepID=UPI0035B31681
MDKADFISLILAKLQEHRADIREQWANPVGTNTRHFIIDNLLPESLARQIYDAFPKDGNGFFNRDSFREKKRTSAHLSEYEPVLANITYAFQDPETVQAVADLVSFSQIEPDPTLYAGGLSMMFEGDFLNPHLDNSHDASRARFRRLNLLYYVSPDWKLENGGNFELWDEDCKVNQTLVSKFNRLIVMETNKRSWHSVSQVQVDLPRCCVSNYFFSEVSPDPEEPEYFHVTSFTGRPNELGKRAVGAVDNALRNAVSKLFRIGRNKDQINDQ